MSARATRATSSWSAAMRGSAITTSPASAGSSTSPSARRRAAPVSALGSRPSRGYHAEPSRASWPRAVSVPSTRRTTSCACSGVAPTSRTSSSSGPYDATTSLSWSAASTSSTRSIAPRTTTCTTASTPPWPPARSHSSSRRLSKYAWLRILRARCGGAVVVRWTTTVTEPRRTLWWSWIGTGVFARDTLAVDPGPVGAAGVDQDERLERSTDAQGRVITRDRGVVDADLALGRPSERDAPDTRQRDGLQHTVAHDGERQSVTVEGNQRRDGGLDRHGGGGSIRRFGEGVQARRRRRQATLGAP